MTRAAVGIGDIAANLRGVPSVIVVHHDDADPPPDPDGAAALWRAHDAYHRSKRWGGIGYHRGIDPWGIVYEGRDLDQVAVAAPGYNQSGAHYCLIGCRQAPATDAARRALVSQISADGLSGLQRLCHRDVNATDCPNDANAEWVHAGMPIGVIGPLPPSVDLVLIAAACA